MSVKVVFSASDALFEGGQIAHDQVDEVELGPYQFVQATYDLLCDDRGNTVATLVDGLWVLGTQSIPAVGGWAAVSPAPDGPRFSDIVVFNSQESDDGR